MRHVGSAAALLLLAGILSASAEDEVTDTIRRAAEALRDRNAAALWLLFDPKMTGYARMRSDSGALLADAEVQSNIEITKNEGGDTNRQVVLDWRLEILRGERIGSATERRAKVECRLDKRDGKWRIVQFAPADFFAPPRGPDAWYVLSAAASALNRPLNLDETQNENDPTFFLRAFDKSMPGYEKLRLGVTALMRRGPVESSIELVRNEGNDRTRTLEIDWTLQVLDERSGLAVIHREQRVQCRMEWTGKEWRVESISPLEFFTP